MDFLHLLYAAPNGIKEFIQQPWSWYVSGAMISLVMLLLLLAGKNFGVSSTLRTACAMGGAGKQCSFFDMDWKNQIWNIVFVLGAIIGGFLASSYMGSTGTIELASATKADLAFLGIPYDEGLIPTTLFSWEALMTWQGLLVMVLGGFLVGFGARWAGGCTSGHAISGLSNLQLPSLIAVIGFFIGGLVMTHVFFPLIFNS